MQIQNNFTQKLIEVLNHAHSRAQGLEHQQITPYHLFASFVENAEGLAKDIYKDLPINHQSIETNVEEHIQKLPKVSGSSVQIGLSNDAQKVINESSQIAQDFGDEYISNEHLLLALIKVSSTLSKLLSDNGVHYEETKQKVQDAKGDEKIQTDNPEEQYKTLEKYGTNLTELAQKGKIDPVIGRDDEIRRVMEILTRRSKNNPVLIGEPGTGKTTIVEGLAKRIIDGDVPDNLKNKTLVVLDIGSMIAGAKYRGEFEERFKAVLKEIKNKAEEMIVFVDELHTIVGAGAVEGQMDASNMIKPELARGTLHMIGATTLNEYQKYIEKDAALERRFQPVYVDEPSVEDTITILRGIKDRYELHHGVRITDEAIINAAELSHRYIPQRFLPDKAVDLVDEATASLKLELESEPLEIEKLRREKMSLEIEREAVKREKDNDKIEKVNARIAEVDEKLGVLRNQWNKEREIVQSFRDIKTQTDEKQREAEILERQGELSKVAEIRYGTIPELQNQLQQAQQNIQELGESSLIREEVRSEDIAKVVARWTGIPVDKMLASESEKLLELEDHLHERVVGQDEAVSAVARAIRRSRSGLSDPNKPIASFLFLGPTGVGKTELTKALASEIMNDEQSIIRIDMSEYMEKFSVQRLIGSPPGYVGYDEGGQLTEAVRRRPYSIVLFDEVEKAHPDVFNLLLQLLDEGTLTDNKGRHINFKNTIVVMTSNLGSETIQNETDAEKMRQNVMESVREFFRPEFLNRIDETIIFQSLSKDMLSGILDVHLKPFYTRMHKQDIQLSLTEAAKQHIINVGADLSFGARPLKRAIQTELVDPIAQKLISNEIKPGDQISVDYKEKQIQIKSS